MFTKWAHVYTFILPLHTGHIDDMRDNKICTNIGIILHQECIPKPSTETGVNSSRF